MRNPIRLVLATLAVVAVILGMASPVHADRWQWDETPNCITFREFRHIDDGMTYDRVRQITGVRQLSAGITGYFRCRDNPGMMRDYVWIYFPDESNRMFRHRWSHIPKIELWYCDWYGGLAVGCTITPDDLG